MCRSEPSWAEMNNIQIAFATDMGYFEPTLIAMMSVLKHASRPFSVHFLGYQLADDAKRRLELACRSFADADLSFHELDKDMLAGATQKTDYISLVTLGRLGLPKLAQGQVLYIDGDTITYGDVATLFDLDMKGALIGAVRDVVTLKNLFKKYNNLTFTKKIESSGEKNLQKEAQDLWIHFRFMIISMQECC